MPVAHFTNVGEDGPARQRPTTDRRRTPRSQLVFRSDATFPPLPQSLTEARRWCQDALREWGVTVDTSAVLSLCEDLVAFALRYGRGEIHLALSTGPTRIAIAATRAQRPVRSQRPDVGREVLARVRAKATKWGVRENAEGGTTVWAEVAVG
jgi:hypothetical protein